jgi:hypothetical protein
VLVSFVGGENDNKFEKAATEFLLTHTHTTTTRHTQPRTQTLVVVKFLLGWEYMYYLS